MEGGRAGVGDLRCTFDVAPLWNLCQFFVVPSMMRQRSCHSIISNVRASSREANLPCKVHHEICSQGKVFFRVFGMIICKAKLKIADAWNPA